VGGFSTLTIFDGPYGPVKEPVMQAHSYVFLTIHVLCLYWNVDFHGRYYHLYLWRHDCYRIFLQIALTDLTVLLKY
jgi:hypothetical protein